jgi:hypothetical protein
LEEAVLCNDEALRKEKIVLILRVNVGYAPTVALDANDLLQTVDVEGSANYRYGCLGPGFQIRSGILC